CPGCPSSRHAGNAPTYPEDSPRKERRMPGLESPWHWLILIVVLALLFGSRRLPDAARSLGQSLRIFKAEMKGAKQDEEKAQLPPTAAAVPPAAPAPPQPVSPPAPAAEPTPVTAPPAPPADHTEQ